MGPPGVCSQQYRLGVASPSPTPTFTTSTFSRRRKGCQHNHADSKATFSLLMQLFALSAGETPSMEPILTLPIGIGSRR